MDNNVSYMELLSSGNYLTVNKTLAKHLGLVETCFLGALIDRHRVLHTNNNNKCLAYDGFFKYQTKAIENNLGLSNHQTGKYRKLLEDAGLIETSVRGIPATCWYKVNYDVIAELLNVLAHLPDRGQSVENKFLKFLKTSIQKISKLDSKKFKNYYIYINNYINNNYKLALDELEGGSSDTAVPDTAAIPAEKKSLDSIMGNEITTPEKPKTTFKKSITKKEELEVYEVYRQYYVTANISKRTQGLVEGIPRAISIYRESYEDKAVEALKKDLVDYASSDWFKAKVVEVPYIASPKTMFSEKFIRDTLILFNLKPNHGRNRTHNKTTQEERDRISKANKEQLREYLEGGDEGS